MSRTIVALVAEVVLVVLVALLLGAAWQWVLAGELAGAAVEAARLLFFFMDVGLAVWVVILIVLTVRRRALPGIGATLVAALIGFVANALTVLVVSLLQGSGAVEYLTYAIDAGVAFLLAVLVVAPAIRRLNLPSVKPAS